jgi:hypothetical protein
MPQLRREPIGSFAIVAAMLAVVGVAVAVGALQPVDVAVTPSPSEAPIATLSTSETPSPAGLVPGTVVRATGEVALDTSDSWSIRSGQLAYIVEGPLPGRDGAPSYRLQTWGDLTSGLKPDTVFGLAAATDVETKLVMAPPDCPTGEPTLGSIAALQPFERLVCFGSRELTFGPVTASTYSVGARTSPRWLSAEGRPDFFTGLPYYTADQGTAIADGEWVSVTGHFDEPSSLDCGDPGDVVWCRERFFITSTRPVDAPSFVLTGTWRQTALPPIDGRTEHRLVWTGREMLVWGGYASNEVTSVFDAAVPSDGAAYNPATDQWRPIPAAPVAGRGSPLTAWTGSEMLVFGGATFDASGVKALLDGAAYDPSTDTWRKIAASPLTGDGVVGGWLSNRLVVITSTAAAAYDPATDRWTGLPPAPIRPGWRTAVVAGGRLIVIAFGDGATPPAQESTLDPTTWTWASADLAIDPQMAGMDFIGIGDGVVSPLTGQTFDPISREWGSVTACERASGGIWTGRFILSHIGAWDSVTDTCLDVPPSPPREPPFNESNGREFAVAVWTGEEYLTWSGGNGGDIVWVPKDGAAFRPEP